MTPLVPNGAQSPHRVWSLIARTSVRRRSGGGSVRAFLSSLAARPTPILLRHGLCRASQRAPLQHQNIPYEKAPASAGAPTRAKVMSTNTNYSGRMLNRCQSPRWNERSLQSIGGCGQGLSSRSPSAPEGSGARTPAVCLLLGSSLQKPQPDVLRLEVVSAEGGQSHDQRRSEEDCGNASPTASSPDRTFC